MASPGEMKPFGIPTPNFAKLMMLTGTLTKLRPELVQWRNQDFVWGVAVSIDGRNF
jgi:hypothetical protein